MHNGNVLMTDFALLCISRHISRFLIFFSTTISALHLIIRISLHIYWTLSTSYRRSASFTWFLYRAAPGRYRLPLRIYQVYRSGLHSSRKIFPLHARRHIVVSKHTLLLVISRYTVEEAGSLMPKFIRHCINVVSLRSFSAFSNAFHFSCTRVVPCYSLHSLYRLFFPDTWCR